MKTKYWLNCCWQLGFVGFLVSAGVNTFACKALAQTTPSNIQPDTTLGAESSQIIQNFQGQPIEVITGGATRGINLFHSFQEFNVSEGRGAYFFSPSADIQNILARVTGGNRSEILGKLGTFGNSQPNLFLINPNGIIFGENASLDVQGSFVATTANGVQFGNQGLFSATNPEALPLLTVNPSALFFNQINRSAAIQNNSIAPTGKDPTGLDALGLRVPNGKSLLLVGGNVSMDGGELNAYGGRIELGGLAAPGNVALLLDGNNFGLSFPENVPRADISLSNEAEVYVEAAGGGSIAVNARNLEILGGSKISAGIGRGLGTADTVAGDITLNATGEIKIVGMDSNVFNNVRSQAQGKGGNINVNAGTLLVRDGAQVAITTLSAGNGGNLTINADSVKLIATSADGRTASGLGTTSTNPGSTGNAGNVTINTQDLLVQDGAQVSAGTLNAGNGGNLTINADRSVQVIGRSADGRLSSGLLTSSNPGSKGNAGDLTINTQDLLVRDGAQVSAATSGAGKGGNLTINADRSVKVIGRSADGRVGSYLVTSADIDLTGKAGDLTINTQDLLVRDGAQVQSGTLGAGKGGNLTVNASNSVQVIGRSANDRVGSGLFTSAETGSTENAGDLTINTQNLLVRDGAQVKASTSGIGKGGNLTVNASNRVQVIGTSVNGSVASGLYSQADSTGIAGDLMIKTQDLLVSGGAQVSASTFGAGKGGNLTVNASNSVQVIGTSVNSRFGSNLSAQTNQGSTGNAGDLTINTQDLLVWGGAKVSTGTLGAGKGGNLIVNALNSIQLIGESGDGQLGSGLFTQTDATGAAGDLRIKTQDLLVQDGAVVSAGTFGSGKGGNLTVNASNSVQLNGTSADGRFPSGLFAASEPRTTGAAGDLKIITDRLLVGNGAGISVGSSGTGNAGIMTINANTIRLDNKASLNANTRSPNKDPNREQATININTRNLTLRRNSNITTNASGENVIGGNININTKFLIAPENSRISANSDNSRGGRVRINAQGVFVGTKLSDVSNYITATSGVGLSGSVDVNSPDNSSIQNSLTELSQNFIDTNALIANSCIARGNRKQQGSFLITGKGGLPNRPGDALVSNYPTGSVRNVISSNQSSPINQGIWKKGDPIVEAEGVYRTASGQLILSHECK